MEIISVCRGLSPPQSQLLGRHRRLCSQSGFGSSMSLKDRMVLRHQDASSSFPRLGRKQICEDSLLRRLKRGSGITMCALSSDSKGGIGLSGSKGSADVPIVRSSGVEPFRGKSGSVSFYGLTHQLVEEAKLESAPFMEDKGSFMWLLAPVALISSLILPQFFLVNAIEAFVKNETVAEMVTSLFFEAIPKRWSLITGLRGYLNSVFLTMGFKVVIPLFMVYITWPVVGVPAIVAVAPFLVGCLAQLIFEKILDRKGSSCWPAVPIIFEVYRLYQLTKAAHYIERLMFAMKDLPTTPEMLDRSGALVAMIVSFQALGLLCLWSLITFLLRLFPSRPVAENY
ncbi:hypothetical protein CRG98_010676 [Punica granatum]|uniref:Uncharacterized protein n=1 Tax=Punica granatum TaxID=22663 RepID=A0A2I0KK68_PUNGR|nr:hypothetical protein CRG98_010676 [Punica granatum]